MVVLGDESFLMSEVPLYVQGPMVTLGPVCVLNFEEALYRSTSLIRKQPP